MNRKSISIAIFLSLILAFTAQAQLKFGLKAGVNISKAQLSGVGDFNADNLNVDNFVGFQVGPIVEFIVPVIHLGFDAAILYSNEGFKLPPQDAVENAILSEVKTYKSNQILIPVNLKYKLSLPKIAAVFATVGPYARFQFEDVKKQYESKTFGVGMNLGLGVELLEHLQVAFNWQLGLSDDYSNLDIDPSLVKKIEGKTSTKTISLAYFF